MALFLSIARSERRRLPMRFTGQDISRSYGRRISFSDGFEYCIFCQSARSITGFLPYRFGPTHDADKTLQQAYQY